MPEKSEYGAKLNKIELGIYEYLGHNDELLKIHHLLKRIMSILWMHLFAPLRMLEMGIFLLLVMISIDVI